MWVPRWLLRTARSSQCSKNSCTACACRAASPRPASASVVSQTAARAAAAPRVVLTRQDWKRLPRGRGWGNAGYWLVHVESPGPFDVEIRHRGATPTRLELAVGGETWTREWGSGKTHTLAGLRFPTGDQRLDVASQFDHCFWFGDLNYRVSAGRSASRPMRVASLHTPVS